MPWEASTDFEGVRPPGFPGSIPVDGGSGCPGWLPAPVTAATSALRRVWSRLPWQPSELADDAWEIRDQGGWGFPAYGTACADVVKRYAVLEITGTARRLVSSGSCAGQVDDQRVATDWVETWDWTFQTTADDPGTEEIDETAYEVVIGSESAGTFQRTTNSWTPSGGSCIFGAGTPVDVDPPAASTAVSGVEATWSYPTVSGFTPDGALEYTLSSEITTTTISTLLDEWMLESDEFRQATGGGTVIYETESPDGTYGRAARGRVRFDLKASIPEGYKAVVDYVLRESAPIDRLGSLVAAVIWNSGTASITLTDEITTSADALGEWPRAAIETSDVDEAPWEVSAGTNAAVGVNSSGGDGDCGLLVRVASLAPGRRFRLACNMDWSSSGGSGEDDFTLEMAEEPGEPPRTPAVYWNDHAPDAVSGVTFRYLVEPGDIEEWIDGAWAAVAEADITGAIAVMAVEFKARGGGPWGFRNFDPAIGDPAAPAWYEKASISVNWSITGTNPDSCGDDPAGSLVFLGDVTVDAAGRYLDDLTTDTAEFGGLSYNPDPNIHPDARHPCHQSLPSYLVTRIPLDAPSDIPATADIPTPGDDPFDQAVDVRRDLPTGWGDEVSRTPVELEPSSEFETQSEWVTPPTWPGPGQFATWENLRYEPAT